MKKVTIALLSTVLMVGFTESKISALGIGERIELAIMQKNGANGDHTGKDFANMNFKDVSFVGPTTVTNGPNVAGSNFSHADLTQIKQRLIRNANFSKADLSYANLSSLTLENVIMTYVKGEKTNFVDIKAAGVDFSGSSLSNSEFAGANLVNCNFSNANFNGSTDFFNANLTGAIFKNAKISQSKTVVSFGTVMPNGKTVAQILGFKVVKSTPLKRVTKENPKNYSGNMNGDHSGKNFNNVNFSNANFVGPAKGTNGPNVANSNFAYADLSQIKNKFIRNADFDGTTLSGANFQGIALDPSVIMTNIKSAQGTLFQKLGAKNVNFSGSNLSYAHFADAALTGSNLSNSDLTGTGFEDTYLDKVILKGAKFSNETFLTLGTVMQNGKTVAENLNLKGYGLILTK